METIGRILFDKGVVLFGGPKQVPYFENYHIVYTLIETRQTKI